MKLGTALILTAAVAWVATMVLFFSAFSGKNKVIAKRYADEFPPKLRVRVPQTAMIVGALTVPSIFLALVLAITVLVWMVIESVAQHSRMKALGYEKSYRRHLMYASCVSAVAIGSLFGGVWWYRDYLS